MVSSAGHKAKQVWRSHDHSRLIKNALQFVVGIFLDSLGVLKFLNQLHLYALHIHHLFFLHEPYLVLVVHLVKLAALGCLDLPLSFLLYFLRGQSLLLVDDCILHAVFSVNLKLHVLALLLELLPLDFCLLPLLLLAQIDSLLHFAAFVVALVLNVDVLRRLHLQ